MLDESLSEVSSEKSILCIQPSDASVRSYDELWQVAETSAPPGRLCTADVWQLAVAIVASVANGKDLVVCSQPTSQPSIADCPDDKSYPTSYGCKDISSFKELVDRSPTRIGIQTSGSTGEPKQVWHRLPTLIRSVRCSPKHRSAIWGLAFHPCHFAGLQVFFQAFMNETPIVSLFELPTDSIHAAVEQFGITHISGTPTFFNLLCYQNAPDHRHVQRITTGGERLSQPVIDRIRACFPNARLNNVYASTEAGSILSADGETFTISKELVGLVKVIDGELAVHRSLIADSIKHQDGESDVSWTWQGDYLLTGDFVEFLPHPEGDKASVAEARFRICGRESDIINVGGYNVNLLEVEAALLNLPEIREVRAYGQPNSVVGNIIACDIVASAAGQLTARDLHQRLKDNLSPYKIPRIVNHVVELPQTVSGKRARRG